MDARTPPDILIVLPVVGAVLALQSLDVEVLAIGAADALGHVGVLDGIGGVRGAVPSPLHLLL